MKLYLLLFIFSLTACGQIGPLYLPDSKPPIAVGPKPKPEAAPAPTKPTPPNK